MAGKRRITESAWFRAGLLAAGGIAWAGAVPSAAAGSIAADQSVTLKTGTSRIGNSLALTGEVALDSNVVSPPTAGSGGKPSQGKTAMAPPDGGAADDASARIFVKHFPAHGARAERSWFRVKSRRLEGSTDYTLWADDPATPGTELVQFDTFTTKRNGGLHYKQDTRHDGAVPFGATLAEFSGMAVEVRSASGITTILAGTVPTTAP